MSVKEKETVVLKKFSSQKATSQDSIILSVLLISRNS